MLGANMLLCNALMAPTRKDAWRIPEHSFIVSKKIILKHENGMIKW